MLFETLSQPKIFFILTIAGFLTGFVFDASNYIVWLCKKNKIVQLIFDFIATILSFFIFYFIILKINYGSIRIYQVLCFTFSLLIQRITLGKLIAKLLDWCYNYFTPLFQKLLKRSSKEKLKNEKVNKSTKQTF